MALAVMGVGIEPRETDTSHGDEKDKSKIVIREILKFLSRKFAEMTNKSNVPRRSGIRAPRLPIILGSMKPDPTTLKLLTLVRNLQGLAYILTIYAKEDGRAHPLWNRFGYQPFDLVYESADHVDWPMFENVILSSIEAKISISSFMKNPFCSIKLVWIIEEDKVGKRLPMYAEMGWERLITEWRRAFSRADVVVFPDFSVLMLYSTLDTGNFIVSRSPVDVWSHTKSKINQPDLLVLVIGSSFFYNTVAMRDIRPLLKNLTSVNNLPHNSFKLVFLCGNSTDSFRDAFQSTRERRSASDDLDAVDWLSLLNDTYNRDRLCELEGMFLIARQVGNIPRIPLIGFQPWRAAARKVPLSAKAEKVLEVAIWAVGDVIFYWARTDMNSRVKGWSKILNCWSLCDMLNGGLCRDAFEKSFWKMYGLRKEMVALPPMPNDGDYWSILHCWAMPTTSFLEFIMFSRYTAVFLSQFNPMYHDSSGTAVRR